MRNMTSIDEELEKINSKIKAFSIGETGNAGNKPIYFFIFFLIVFITFSMIGISFLIKSFDLTGLGVVAENQSSHTLQTDITVVSSYNYTLKIPDAYSKQNLKSIRVTGALIGEGSASAKLVAENGRIYEVLDNNAISSGIKKPSRITGYASGQSNRNSTDSEEKKYQEEHSSAQKPDKEITINLSYQSGTRWDYNDYGTAYTKMDAVDFTVSGTRFSWQADKAKLCTKWTIDSDETGSSTTVCNGAEDCCSLTGVAPNEEEWDAPFYIYYTQYGVSKKNIVRARVIYINQSLEQGNTYFESAISDESSLNAEFIEPPETSFSQACSESCELPADLQADSYEINFQVGPGAALVISSIEYVLEESTLQEKEIQFIPEITNAQGDVLAADITFIDPHTKNKVEHKRIEKREADVQAKTKGFFNAFSAPENSVELLEGEYDLEINLTDQSSPVRKISLKNAKISSNSEGFIRISDPDEKGNLKNFIEVYSIDPTLINFTNAELTAVAKGTALYKCRSWNFETQTCEGNWELIRRGLTPGEEYTVLLTPEDPAFGEINITAATHLDENRSPISDIYPEVRLKDGVWSEKIFEDEYVRVVFEKNLTPENDITFYARNTQRLETSVEVYYPDSDEMIAEFPVIDEEGYYTVYLTGMEGSQDMFDLKIVNKDPEAAYLEFDHIIDPTYTIFSDNFQTANFNTIWTAAADYVRVTTFGDGSTASIEVDGRVTDVLMTLTSSKNITSYDSCNLTSRLYIKSTFDGSEYLCMDYSTDGGASWNRNAGSDGGVGGLCQDGNVDTEAAWRTVLQQISTPAGITAFKVRFRTTTDNANEDGYVDNVNLTCYYNPPPATATNLKSVQRTNSSIYWNWTKPADADFSSHIIYINNSNVANTSNSYYNATGLKSSTLYTIKIHTKDTAGKVNTTDVTNSNTTLKTIIYSVDLTDPADQTTSPNVNATYTISVTNNGNVPDNYTLAATNYNGADVAQLNQTTILNLNNGSSFNVKLYVTDAAEGAYKVGINATSQNSPAAYDRINITTNVTLTKTYGVSLSYEGDQETSEYENASYEITVTNTGNAIENITLSLTNYNSSDAAELNQTTILELNYSDSFILELFVGDSTPGQYIVEVNATSENDEAKYDLLNATTTVLDTTPPASVTNLQNQSSDYTWIYWTWTNPGDEDFDHAEVWLDSAFKTNTSLNYYNATSLIENSWHTITIYTADESGNRNTTAVESTARTDTTDAVLPAINSITDDPDPIAKGENITITANITDNNAVNSSWASIGGNNYSMRQDNGTTGATETFFTEGFESGTTGWTTSGAGTAWYSSTSNPHTGSAHIMAQNTGAESIISRTISTSGYKSITFMFYAETNGLDAVDWFRVDWYNGTDWTQLLDAEDISPYTLYSYPLPSSADNNNAFAVRFKCSSGNNEQCYVDDVNLTGKPYTDPKPDIWTLEYNTSNADEGLNFYTVYANDSVNNVVSSQSNFTAIGTPEYGVSLSQPANRTVDNTTTAQYTITLTNNGNVFDSFTLAATNYDNADTAELNQSTIENIPPGGTSQILLDVASSTPDNYTVGVNATSEGNSSEFYRINITTEIVEYEPPAVNSLFYDDFETGLLTTNNWFNEGTGTAWFIETTDTTFGTFHAEADNTGTETILRNNISTKGYQDITLSFYWDTDAIDAGEYIAASWYNGTAWKNLLNNGTNPASYQHQLYDLGADAENNQKFSIRFRCLSGSPNEECKIDNVEVTGTDTPPEAQLITPRLSYKDETDIPINITFSCNATDTLMLKNISLYLTNSANTSFKINKTSVITGTANASSWNITLAKGNYTWNCLAYDSGNNSDWADANRTVRIFNITSPYVTNIKPTNAAVYQTGEEVVINATVTDNVNVSQVWFNITLPNGSISQMQAEDANSDHIYNLTFSETELPGTYNITVYANDTKGNFNNTEKGYFYVNGSIQLSYNIYSQDCEGWEAADPGCGGDADEIFDNTGANLTCEFNTAIPENSSITWLNLTFVDVVAAYPPAEMDVYINSESLGTIADVDSTCSNDGERSLTGWGTDFNKTGTNYAIIDNTGTEQYVGIADEDGASTVIMVLRINYSFFVGNEPPTDASLVFPNNGNNTLVNRSFTFLWSASTDPEKSIVTYQINITSELCSDISDSYIVQNNYTPLTELSTYDECGSYNWSVRAYDGTDYSDWSESWNFSVKPYVAFFFITNTIDFGNADNDQTNDTTDDDPPPFVIRNDGNVRSDIINATMNQTFFVSDLYTDADFQIKADNTTELWSFNWTGSATSWINLTTIRTIIDYFDWHDTNDTAEIDVKVHVPIDEGAGAKVTGLVFYGEQS